MKKLNFLLYNGKYITIASIFTILCLYNLWHTPAIWWSSLVFFLYQIFFGNYLGEKILKKEKRLWQIFFGIIFLLTLQITLLSTIYWFFEINIKIISAIIVLIPIVIAFFQNQDFKISEDIGKIDLESYIYTKSHLGTKLLALIIFAGQLILFYTLWTKRFVDTLISPWTIIGPRFFILFTILTALLFWLLQKSKHSLSNLLLLISHGLLTLTVALIIFKIGFGFDPFIHEATEKWIWQHNKILPKNPYYIGYYMLTIFLSSMSKIDLASINKTIVPILSPLFLILPTYLAMKKIISKQKYFQPYFLFFSYH